MNSVSDPQAADEQVAPCFANVLPSEEGDYTGAEVIVSEGPLFKIATEKGTMVEMDAYIELF